MKGLDLITQPEGDVVNIYPTDYGIEMVITQNGFMASVTLSPIEAEKVHQFFIRALAQGYQGLEDKP